MFNRNDRRDPTGQGIHADPEEPSGLGPLAEVHSQIRKGIPDAGILHLLSPEENSISSNKIKLFKYHWQIYRREEGYGLPLSSLLFAINIPLVWYYSFRNGCGS